MNSAKLQGKLTPQNHYCTYRRANEQPQKKIRKLLVFYNHTYKNKILSNKSNQEGERSGMLGKKVGMKIKT